MDPAPASLAPAAPVVHFRPYRAGDALHLQIAREGKVPPSIDALGQHCWAFTAVMKSGDHSGDVTEMIIGCGGLLVMEAHRARAWVVIGAVPRRAWPRIVKRCRTVLRLAAADGIACIEADVALDFHPGHRFARHMGFRFAGLSVGRLPDGGPMIRYVHVPPAQWQRIPASVAAAIDYADRVLRAYHDRGDADPQAVLRAA